MSARTRPMLPGLAALRWFAAVWVVVYHFTPLFHVRLGPLAGVGGNGYLGVNLFYLLSGFVLAYVYLGEDGSAGDRGRFWSARFARIVPVYLLAWAATGFLELQRAGGLAALPQARLVSAALSALLLQSWIPGEAIAFNSPGWSLSVEAFFYLLFPWLLPAMVRFGRPWLVVGLGWSLALLAPAAYLLIDPDGLGAAVGPYAAGPWLSAVKFFPPAHLGTFVAGAGLGLLFLDGRLARIRGPAWGLGILAVFAASTAFPTGRLYPLFHDGLLLPVFGLVIAWCANLRRAPQLLVEAGEASYALYILQFPLWELWWVFIRPLGIEWLGRKALFTYVIYATAVSWLVLVAVERPAREALKRVFARRAPVPARLDLDRP